MVLVKPCDWFGYIAEEKFREVGDSYGGVHLYFEFCFWFGVSRRGFIIREGYSKGIADIITSTRSFVGISL